MGRATSVNLVTPPVPRDTRASSVTVVVSATLTLNVMDAPVLDEKLPIPLTYSPVETSVLSVNTLTAPIEPLVLSTRRFSASNVYEPVLSAPHLTAHASRVLSSSIQPPHTGHLCVHSATTGLSSGPGGTGGSEEPPHIVTGSTIASMSITAAATAIAAIIVFLCFANAEGFATVPSPE